MERLADQIHWYHAHARSSQVCFKALKFGSITMAAVITLASKADVQPFYWLGSTFNVPLSALLGAVIVVVEGAQQLFQWQTEWLLFRSTCEALKREKYLYLAGAGAYRDVPNPRALLAERTEDLAAQEGTRWLTTQEQKPPKAAPA